MSGERGVAAEVEAHIGELGTIVVHLAEFGHVANDEGPASARGAAVRQPTG